MSLHAFNALSLRWLGGSFDHGNKKDRYAT